MQADTMGAVKAYSRGRLRTEMLALGLIAAFIVPMGAFAGKGGGSTVQAWIGLNGVTDASGALAAAAGEPALGDYVTFSTVVLTNINNPRIEVLCYQGDELVFGMAGAIDYAFQLGGGGSTWKDRGGAAACEANLYYFSWKGNTPTAPQLATTSFAAGG